jgi:FtsH-binding integral membrane protein
MACFIVPMSLAIGIGAIRKKIPEAYHINWLLMLLGGGVVALAFEHVAHQEIVLYPPFLTAMSSTADTAVMLQEMATIGSAMLLACVFIWIGMVVYVSKMKETKSKQQKASV